jgi:hypothetical protein
VNGTVFELPGLGSPARGAMAVSGAVLRSAVANQHRCLEKKGLLAL